MDARLREWLDMPYEGGGTYPFEYPSPNSYLAKTRLERIAELVSVNGGTMGDGGYGMIISPGESPYGRDGLKHDEAMELLQYRSCMEGMEVMEPGTLGAVAGAVKVVWKAREAELEKQSTASGAA